MGKVIPFNGITYLDMDAKQVLEQALVEADQMEGIVIMGYTKDGREFFASSYADGGTVNWLLDQTKHKLLTVMVESVDG